MPDVYGRPGMLPFGIPRTLFSSIPNELAVSDTLKRLNPTLSSLTIVGEIT